MKTSTHPSLSFHLIIHYDFTSAFSAADRLWATIRSSKSFLDKSCAAYFYIGGKVRVRVRGTVGVTGRVQVEFTVEINYCVEVSRGYGYFY